MFMTLHLSIFSSVRDCVDNALSTSYLSFNFSFGSLEQLFLFYLEMVPFVGKKYVPYSSCSRLYETVTVTF